MNVDQNLQSVLADRGLPPELLQLSSAIQRCRFACTQKHPGGVIEMVQRDDISRDITVDGELAYTITYSDKFTAIYNAAGKRVIPGAINLPLPAALQFIRLYWPQVDPVLH